MDFLLRFIPDWALILGIIVPVSIIFVSEWVSQIPLIGSFLTKYKPLLLVGMVGLSISCTYILTLKGEKEKQRIERLQVEQKMDMVKERLKILTTRLSERLDTVIIENREITKIVKEKIPVYITVEDDAQCKIPENFIKLYNQTIQ